jgi:hypothetical protein
VPLDRQTQTAQQYCKHVFVDEARKTQKCNEPYNLQIIIRSGIEPRRFVCEERQGDEVIMQMFTPLSPDYLSRTKARAA